uniref:Uncharacterized protein n=1 Tax=Parascaris equorum TaxID=6256 RepID=A0A914RP49_PAREQ
MYHAIFSYTDELLSVEAESVQRRLDVLLGCSLTAGHALGNAVRKCPAVLFASTPKSMSMIAESLSSFFSRAQENPSLQEILDVPDSNFATEVAGVTLEEWLIFRGLTDKVYVLLNL